VQWAHMSPIQSAGMRYNIAEVELHIDLPQFLRNGNQAFRPESGCVLIPNIIDPCYIKRICCVRSLTAIYQRPKEFDSDKVLFPTSGSFWPTSVIKCKGCGHSWPDGARFCFKEGCQRALTQTAMHDEFSHYPQAARALQLRERYGQKTTDLHWHEDMKEGRGIYIQEAAEAFRDSVGGVADESFRASVGGLFDPTAYRTGVRKNADRPASDTKLFQYSKRARRQGYDSHAQHYVSSELYRNQMVRNGVAMYMQFKNGDYVEKNLDFGALDAAWNTLPPSSIAGHVIPRQRANANEADPTDQMECLD
jgi:hypothetical protein